MSRRNNAERTSSNTIGGRDEGWSRSKSRRPLTLQPASAETASSNRDLHPLPKKSTHHDVESVFDTSSWDVSESQAPSRSDTHKSSHLADSSREDQAGLSAGRSLFSEAESQGWSSGNGWDSLNGNGWDTDSDTVVPASSSSGWTGNIETIHYDSSGANSNPHGEHHNLNFPREPVVLGRPYIGDAGKRMIKAALNIPKLQPYSGDTTIPNALTGKIGDATSLNVHVAIPRNRDMTPPGVGHMEIDSDILPPVGDATEAQVEDEDKVEFSDSEGPPLEDSQRLEIYKQIIVLMTTASIIKVDLLKLQSSSQTLSQVQAQYKEGTVLQSLAQKKLDASQRKAKDLAIQYEDILTEIRELPNIAISAHSSDPGLKDPNHGGDYNEDIPLPLDLDRISQIQGYIAEVKAYKSELVAMYEEYQVEIQSSKSDPSNINDTSTTDTTSNSQVTTAKANELTPDQQGLHEDPSLKISADWAELKARITRMEWALSSMVHEMELQRAQIRMQAQTEEDWYEDLIDWEPLELARAPGPESGVNMNTYGSVTVDPLAGDLAAQTSYLNLNAGSSAVSIEVFQEFKKKFVERRNLVVRLQEENKQTREVVKTMTEHLNQLNTLQEDRTSLISDLKTRLHHIQDLRKSASSTVTWAIHKELAPALEALKIQAEATASKNHSRASDLIYKKLEEVLRESGQIKGLVDEWGERFQAFVTLRAQNELSCEVGPSGL